MMRNSQYFWENMPNSWQPFTTNQYIYSIYIQFHIYSYPRLMEYTKKLYLAFISLIHSPPDCFSFATPPSGKRIRTARACFHECDLRTPGRSQLRETPWPATPIVGWFIFIENPNLKWMIYLGVPP